MEQLKGMACFGEKLILKKNTAEINGLGQGWPFPSSTPLEKTFFFFG